MICGYARVSTGGQSVGAQVCQHRAAGAGQVIREAARGAKTDRVQLYRVRGQLAAGAVLMVTRRDWLVRSTFDLFAVVKQIVAAGGRFRSLAEPWADAAASTGRLMIAVLGGLADVESDLIRTRTVESRRRAKAHRQHMGRPPKPTPQRQAGALRGPSKSATLAELAKSYDVGRTTISRLAG